MDKSFSDRIEADIRRGAISSAEDEERDQLERRLADGMPARGLITARLYHEKKNTP